LSKKPSKNAELNLQNGVIKKLVNLRVTFKTASIPMLEGLTFENLDLAIEELSALKSIEECLILQTCNRIELYVVGSFPGSQPGKLVADYWCKKCGADPKQFYSMLETSSGRDALMHILRLTSGLESMIIGEDQILGQIREAYHRARSHRKSGAVLKRVFEGALRTGVSVRRKTQINKGAVSIGSIAVNSLEERLGILEGKKILLIGAGEMGSLVGKALAARKMQSIFVASRTFARASWLAKILNVQAIPFDEIVEPLAFVDAVIVATASPHYILTYETVSAAIKKRDTDKLLIVDLSQPRNVDDLIGGLPGVKLYNIDNLRSVAYSNLQARLDETRKVDELLKSDFDRLVKKLKQVQVEPLISILYGKAENKRRIEVAKALKMIQNALAHQGADANFSKCKQIIEDLSRELVEQTLMEPINNLRTAASNDNLNRILEAEALFNLKQGD
jgi:glutamyl-tRNA reductase